MTIYNGPSVPTTYDPSWQAFTNLTPAQILAFQSFPQDLLIYAKTRRWMAEISGITVAGVPLSTLDRDKNKIGQLMQAFDKKKITSTPFFDAAGNVQTVNATQADAIYTAVVQFVDQTYVTAASLVAGINATPPTITTRAQIDAAYAAFAPNSPSATNPSPT